ncbi:D-alanyl-D-alanine carboxypeptidase family protein [Rhabdaerophilum calidifontis]|uniref:D-alanyl-D-alanine carboxypeptidase family protein n=1 Tax=Rhabdaerophilum calidifontis TaxID=2604328 RepID=UPI00140A2B7B|nr:D-alanyl-D-alanine carboxypeptidase family protein [Rhabdaerophilum calidifontis]
MLHRAPQSLLALLGLMVGALPLRADPMVPTVIVDALSGEVLQAEEATRPWYPASTTKLMTAYVALRAVARGQIKLETPIVVSAAAARQPPSKIGVKPGQEITLENALKIIMVKSANDISTVIAEGIGGSTAGFSAMMNTEARRLGMRESHFVNPHGLHQPEHVSSARDMAILARALLIEFPEYRDLFGIGAVQLGNRKFQNTNGLIGRYSGAMGMKTGFVCASGFNLVSAAERNGRILIAVVFGASSAADRTLKAAQLLDQGFAGGGFFGGSGSGGGGRTLESLTASVETSAPNRRAEICGRRGAPASEEDAGGAIFISQTSNSDRPDSLMSFASPGLASTVGQRAGGRVSLGPREQLAAIPVYLGPKPGSTEIARRPGGAPAGATLQAAAPEPRRKASGAPLALGAIGRATAPAAARPAAAASLQQRARALPAQGDARPAPGPAPKAEAARKQETARKKRAPAGNSAPRS